MLTNKELQRYNRHIILSEIGTLGQDKLKNAHVLVIGAGGLGCPVLQYLAAAGVGNIGLVDYDVVDISNLQRQILYTENQLGKSKAFCAAEAVNRINPLVKVTPFNIRLTNHDALDLLSSYDIIVDGTDNFSTRYMINDACYILKKPMVFGAIHKFEGLVSIFNLKNDSPTYRSIFPESPKSGTIPNCSEIGVIGVLPGIIGSLQASEVIKIITNIGEPLDGKMLYYDNLNQSLYTIIIDSKPEDTHTIQPSATEFVHYDYSFNCELKNDIQIKSISALELKKNPEKYRKIDIRESYEVPILEIFEVEKIPLSTIDFSSLKINKQPTVIICQRGLRSKVLILKLLEDNPNLDLYNLEGGVESIL